MVNYSDASAVHYCSSASRGRTRGNMKECSTNDSCSSFYQDPSTSIWIADFATYSLQIFLSNYDEFIFRHLPVVFPLQSFKRECTRKSRCQLLHCTVLVLQFMELCNCWFRSLCTFVYSRCTQSSRYQNRSGTSTWSYFFLQKPNWQV